MTNHMSIHSFIWNDRVAGYYIICNIRNAFTKAGKPFLRATLSDASGSIGMVFWDYEGDFTPANDGEIIVCSGQVGVYQDALQLNADSLAPAYLTALSADDIDTLVPVAPIDIDECMYYVWKLADSIQDPQIHKLCNYLLHEHWDLFTTIPAAKSVHHAFRYGLLMHTADMLFLAEAVAARHPTVNRDLLICGVILHDIGKLYEFELSPVTGLVKSYSPAGNLVGHSCLGAIEVARAAEALGIDNTVSLAIEHMILAHHGDPAYGAAKVPMTIEAELLHCLDMLDSRHEIFIENAAGRNEQAGTSYIPALDRTVYHCKAGIAE